MNQTLRRKPVSYNTYFEQKEIDNSLIDSQMKKILILLALLATQSLYAQHWTKETESGDELLGTSDRVKFKYVDSINVQAFCVL